MSSGDLTPPLVVLNYKVYPQALGKNAAQLTRTLEDAATSYPEATVAVCPSHVELAEVARATSLPVLAQTVWGDRPGSGTGKVLVDSLEAIGASGALLNHAECQVDADHVEQAIDRLDDVGMTSIVCAADEEATRAATALGPTYVAMEPPALIGGDVSVTSADPGIVERSVATAAKEDDTVPVLCGAGVKDGKDVATALELGTHGVLVASGVVKAKDPDAALTDLLEGTLTYG